MSVRPMESHGPRTLAQAHCISTSGVIRMRQLLALLFLLALAARAHGVTISATGVSWAEVNAAVEQALPGDTVLVPAGATGWTNQLIFAKNITLQGAGAGLTIITNLITPRNFPEKPLVRATTELNGSFRLTGFQFVGGPDTTETFDGEVVIRGTCQSARVDHCKFYLLHGTVLSFRGFVLGVADHNDFEHFGSHPIIVNHEDWQP